MYMGRERERDLTLTPSIQTAVGFLHSTQTSVESFTIQSGPLNMHRSGSFRLFTRSVIFTTLAIQQPCVFPFHSLICSLTLITSSSQLTYKKHQPWARHHAGEKRAERNLEEPLRVVKITCKC